MAGTKSSSGNAGQVPPRPGTRGPARPGPGPARRPTGSGAGGPRAGRPVPRASGRQVTAQRRQRKVYLASAAVGLLVVIVAFALVSTLANKSSPNVAAAKAEGLYPLPSNVLSQVQEVPVSTLVANAEAASPNDVRPPEKLPPKAPQLSSGGHPEVMFICAEYWPSCAAERWALVMALSKFGTFSNLMGTTSSSRETSPRTPTFSFYGATYSSKYLTLITDELETNRYNPAAREYPLLQFPSRQEMSIINAWDVAPYTTKRGSIPFAYMGGKFLITSAQYDASAISQMKFQTAAGIMTSGKSTVSKHAEAAAGYLVGDFCALTHDQPTSVCSQVPSSLVGITTLPAT
jgi:hypothetical protein